MKKLIALILVILIVPVSAGAADSPQIGQVFTGVHAPYMVEGGLPSHTDFFTDADFSQYRLTLLNLWDSNCVNCRIELPFFQRAYEQYHDMGVNIVGVACRFLGGSYEHGWEIINDFGLTYPQVIIDDGISAVSSNLFFVPQTYFVDSTGVVIGFYGGFAEYDLVEDAILRALAVPGDADCDGVLTLADVSAVSACAMNAGSLSRQGFFAADIDGDGTIGPRDISIICSLFGLAGGPK